MSTPAWHRPVVRLAVTLLALACGGEQTAPTRVDATLSILSGAGQADSIDMILPVPLIVAVQDTFGRPAANVAVDWGTAGDCPDACFVFVSADSGNPASQTLRTTTDAAGQAKVWVQLRQTPGTGMLAIVVPDLGLTGSATFEVRAGGPAVIRVALPDLAVALGFVGQFDAELTDRAGNPLPTPLTYTPATPGIVEIGADGVIGSLAFGRTTVTIQADTFDTMAYVSVVPTGLLAVGTYGGAPTSLVVSTTGTDRVAIPPIDYFGQPVNAAAPAWSPDGSTIAFEAPLQTGRAALYTAPVGGIPTVLVQVTPSDSSASQPRWSRDGQWIYYQAFTYGPPVAFSGEIWRVRPNGSGAERVGGQASGLESDYTPDPSPDGTEVAFSTTRGRNPQDLPMLMVRTVATGTERPLMAGRRPRWSPDGRWIAFLRDFTDGGFGAVWLVRPDGSEAHAVTGPGVYYDNALDWSPDGEWLVGYDGLRISLVQVSTGVVLPIGQLQYFDSPAWRP